jgi:DJ-1/PfpI family
VNVDLPLAEAKADQFDAMLLPGGALNADALRMEKQAQELVRSLDKRTSTNNPSPSSATRPGCWFPQGSRKAEHLPAITRFTTISAMRWSV